MAVQLGSDLLNWPENIGGPQSSAIGRIIILTFINDYLLKTSRESLIFAEDIKIWRRLRCPENVRELQDYIHKLSVWAETWPMEFSAGKCVVPRTKT